MEAEKKYPPKLPKISFCSFHLLQLDDTVLPLNSTDPFQTYDPHTKEEFIFYLKHKSAMEHDEATVDGS